MRLIRTLLLLAGTGFMLPSPPEAEVQAGQQTAEVGTFQMMASASSAFADVASFCVRQPGVCETAGSMAGKLEAKAKYSARLIYEWASDAPSDPPFPADAQEAIKADLMTTGSVQLADASHDAKASQSTLKIEDLIPEWRGPAQKPPQPRSEDKKEG